MNGNESSTEQQGCENCFSCQKCFTGQDEQCENCFSCQKCFTGQEEEQCENCFVCQKCFSEQTNQPMDSGNFGLTYFLFPTNECNLRCKYCYATKNPANMDEPMRLQVLKFIFEMEEARIPGRNVHVQFFGGEPTMRWDWMTKLMEDGERIAKEKGMKPVRWGMTTNGTLLTEERLQWMKAHNMTVLLSLDGRKETHNKYRLTREGGGSFDSIPLDLILKYYPNIETRPTIMPDTVEDWPADLAWFHAKGMYTIATEVAYEADWTDEAMEKARITYNKLGDMYIDFKKKGQRCWMKFIEDGRNFLGVKKQQGFICGIARNTVGINAKGWLFACQRYASFADSDLSLGDIWKGFDNEKLTQWNDMKREYMYPHPDSGFKCEDCVALWRCRGGCNAMNHQCNGDRKIVLENHCKFQKLWAEISLRVLAATGELWDKTIQTANQCRPK